MSRTPNSKPSMKSITLKAWKFLLFPVTNLGGKSEYFDLLE
jgi:hypothetical protein